MIFSNLLKPKWQHRNPEVRQLEVENLADPTILHQVALNDVVVSVRQAAVRKITELNVLNEISQHDIDESVQELAKQRLRQLICCRQKEYCPPLEDRLNWIKTTDDTELLVYIIENAPEVDLRLLVIDKINREGLLGDIAVNDLSSEVRLAAVAKLTQKSTLERVVKAARNRDKKVSKIAKEKLDAVIEELERPAKILAESKAICAKLESLERRLNSEKYQQLLQVVDGSNPLNSEQAELQRLQEHWQEINIDNAELQDNFTKLKSTITTLLDEHQHTLLTLQKREKARLPLRTAKQELCDKAEALLIEFKNYQYGKDTTALEQRFEALKQQWAKAKPLDLEAEEKSWQERFARLSQSMQKRQQKLQEYHKTITKLQNICHQGDKLTSKKIVKVEQVKNLQDKWDKISQPEESLPIFTELNQSFSSIITVLQSRLQQQKKQCNEKNIELEKILLELETAVEAGELKTALPLEKQARQLVNEINNLSVSKAKFTENRLQDCGAKIGKLRSWQNWSGEQGRENLCQQVEELLTKDIPPDESITLVGKAQEAWKQLGSSGYSPELWKRFDKNCQTVYQKYREYLCLEMEQLCEKLPEPETAANLVRKAQTDWKLLKGQGNSQELWERFNKACQIAYEPCKTYFEEKANERQQNLLKREELCEQLEKFIATVDWDAGNWKEVRRFCHNMENDWRAIGVTNRKDKKVVQSRFTSSIELIKSKLKIEQQRNCHERLLLLYQAENLADSLTELMTKHSDADVTIGSIKEKIDTSINTVKKLQEQWKNLTIVPGSNRAEHEFWEVFRKSCDKIFNYRKQQQEITKKQRQTHLEARISLCERIEALVNDDKDIQTIPTQLQQLQEEWQQLREEYQDRTDTPKNIKAKDAIEDRFKKSSQYVLAHHNSYLALERRKQLDLLKQKVSFCVELEQDGNQIKLAAMQKSWNELAKLDNSELEAKVEQRFQAICTAINNNTNVGTEENVAIKETLCIRMEILAGIESPPEANGARLAYQVERLSAAINGNPADTAPDPKIEVETIEWEWYSSGAVPTAKTRSLEQRFHRAVTAFYANYSNS